MLRSFEMMRPVSRIAAQIRLWDNMWSDEFVRSYRVFDRWTNEQIPFPGECFRQLTKELQWENRWYKGELRLDGRRVDVGRITRAVPARDGRARPHRARTRRRASWPTRSRARTASRSC